MSRPAVSRPPQSSFDRVRPRSVNSAADPGPVAAHAGRPVDRHGRRALFSVDEPDRPAFGAVSIECSSCHEISVLAMRRALRVAFPSVYLPIIRGRYPALLHCPACSEWTWTRVRVRL